MSPLIEVANAIQLAVAPAFLLTGIGATLSVMTNRLARIIDRYRILDEKFNNLNSEELHEINLLRFRARWTHWAIALTTSSALLICIVIALIFVATEVQFNFDQYIAFSFIGSTGTLIFGLISFTREIALSKNVVKNKN
jgi:hypothetical protein